MHEYLLLAASLSYLAAAVVLYRHLLGDGDYRPLSAIALTGIGAIMHSITQWQHWFGSASTPEISFLHVLSLCSLTVVLLLLVSLTTSRRLFDAGLIALPLAAVMPVIEWWTDAPGNLLVDNNSGMGVHIVSSVMAFGFLSLGGVYAFFVALIDHFLRHHRLNKLVQALPALDVLEALLFSLIKIGFALLTLSLATGLIFIDDMFAQRLVHKTVLSMMAWILFAILLWGRRFQGWRGRTAVRLTLAGVLLLVLAYFGSKLILEVVLGRSWG